MSYKIEKVPDCGTLIGEGPHWDIETQSLYMVDVHGKKLQRFDYVSKKVYRSKIENETSRPTFIIPIKGKADKFIVALKNRVVIIAWDGKSETCKVEKDLFVVEEEDKYKNNNINDGKCDTHGRLFTGSMNEDFLNLRTGNFFRMDGNGIKLLMTDVGLSNGLTFNENAGKFYFNDSMDFKVRSFDYDVESGEIKNPKVLYNIEDQQKDGKKILPDGITIDSEGYIYVAFFNGSNVLKLDPNSGKVLLEIKLPCEQITSLAFGGPNLDILFITTGALEGKPLPAGETFMVTGLGAKGLPMSKFKLP